jgi:splicing factor 3B subunit 1
MFHPARRVREIYWKIYNNMYLGGQDNLVAAYSNFKDDATNSYRRTELELMI